MKNIIKKIIPLKYHITISNLAQKFNILTHNKSYSQEGEDLILKRFFENKKKGIYIDVGANHPTLYSNTYIFYKQGWKGINIEPIPEKIKLFKKIRPRDINLSYGISTRKEENPLYIFQESQLSTFDKNIALSRNKKYKTSKIQCLPLKTILDKNNIKHIDFLTIDTEGFEIEVLKSNNWRKYMPTIILIEDHEYHEKKGKTRIHDFLTKKGYNFYARTNNTSFYINKKSTY